MRFDIVAGDSIQDNYGNVWIWDRKHNIIGYFQGEKYDFNIVNKYEEESFDGFDLYMDNGIIYITSQTKTAVLAYDMCKNSFQNFSLAITKKASQYYSARLDRDRILMIAFEMCFASVIFNIRTGNFEEIFLLESGLYDGRTISRLTTTEKEIIVSLSDLNEIILLNKEDLSILSRCINHIDNIGGIYAESADDMWIISGNGESLVRYINGEEIRIEIGEKVERDLFSRLVKSGDNLVALPRRSEEIYIYNIQKGKMIKIKMPEDIRVPDGRSSLFWNCFKKENKLVLLPWAFPYVLELDLNIFSTRTYKVGIEVDIFDKYAISEIFYEYNKEDLFFLFEVVERRRTVRNESNHFGLLSS